jgi:membrane associated rhomboid family serine protease
MSIIVLPGETPRDTQFPGLSRIGAYSRRQAMDWSLVLVSQGIEAVIEQPQADGSWGLWVPVDQFAAARQAIRQYRLENRYRPWQQHVLAPGLIFDWGSLAWVGLLLAFYAVDSDRNLQSLGLMDSVAVSHGQWWRLFTAVWLHGDLAHLATNAAIGLVLLGLAMGCYGTGAGLLAAYLCGAAGNALAGALSAGPHRSLGASGMVMASLGLLAVHSLSLWRKSPNAPRYIIGGLMGGTMLFVLLALTPGTDIVAHLGGFISGLLLGIALISTPAITRTNWSNLICGFVFVVLVIVPWWLAFRN